jgi:hypothetical protein
MVETLEEALRITNGITKWNILPFGKYGVSEKNDCGVMLTHLTNGGVKLQVYSPSFSNPDAKIVYSGSTILTSDSFSALNNDSNNYYKEGLINRINNGGGWSSDIFARQQLERYEQKRRKEIYQGAW